jgi:hypothetical protein
MKLVKYKSKICGIQLADLTLTIFKSPAITAHYALVQEEGTFCGKVTKDSDFSEKTLNKLQEFIASLEDDMISAVFEIPKDEEAPTEAAVEVPQF